MSDSDDTQTRQERHKVWQRAYQKKRKARCKEMGICPSCEKRPPAENRTCCVQCLEDKKLAARFGTAGPYRQLYAELYERQGGRCGVCLKSMSRPLLDHNHETMEVRGLLCSNCNVGLGQFKDNADLLMKAHKYITENAGIGIMVKKRKG